MIDELKKSVVRTLMRAHGETNKANKANIERYLERRMQAVLKDVLVIALSGVRHKYYTDDDAVKLFLSTTYRKHLGADDIKWQAGRCAGVTCTDTVQRAL